MDMIDKAVGLNYGLNQSVFQATVTAADSKV
jgi:hypothetical protein